MTASPARCLAVGLGATALAAALAAWLVPVAAHPVSGAAFDEVLVRLCATVATIGVAWLWAATVVTIVGAVRADARPARGVPSVVRRWVLAACGAGLAAGLAGPTLAGSASATPGDLHTERRPVSTLAGLPLPDRAVGLPGRASIGTGPLHDPQPGATVVVRPGDTLWALADRHLGDPHRWPELYAINGEAIGPDPDVIQPATRLRLPADRPEENR